MKVVLINPESPFLIRQDVMPPLGLWYVSQALKDAGYEVELVDMGLGDKVPIGAGVYGVTGTSAQAERIEHIAYLLRKEKGFKMIGGAHATLWPKKMLRLGFDAVVQHEAEVIAANIVKNRRPGIYATERLRHIDNYFPDRTQEYRYHYDINGIPAVTMMTSRGCPYACAFCSKAIWGRLCVWRSAKSVEREIDTVYPKYRAIMFYDDTLVINRKRLYDLCDMLKDRQIIWRAFACTSDTDQKLLARMKESGCVEIGVGIESGSASILAGVTTKATLETHRQCVKDAHAVGLRVKGFVIAGLPGETWQTIGETDRFLEEIQLDDVDISVLSVYGGSRIHDHREEFDLKFSTPTFYKGKPGEYVCHVSTSRMTASEILAAREMLHRKHKKAG